MGDILATKYEGPNIISSETTSVAILRIITFIGFKSIGTDVR